MNWWRKIAWLVLAIILLPLVVMAQQMLVPGGNSNQPGIAFSNDSQQDTGLRRYRENAVSTVTGGMDRWIVDESGHFLPVATNTYDVGNASTNLVRNVAAGGTLHVLGSLAHITAQVRLGDGVATAPALAFLQYPNTGLYRSGSPGVGVAVGGSGVWEFTSGDLLPVSHGGTGLGSATQMIESVFSLDYVFWVRSNAANSPTTKRVLLYMRDDVNQDGAATNDCVLRARLQSGAEVHIATLVLDGTCP